MIYGFLSDAHGNVEAFTRGVEVLRENGAEAVWFLGDAVGYLPGTSVVGAVAATCDGAVLGNHDEAVLAGTVDPERDQVLRHATTAAALTDADREVMQGWPLQRVLDTACGSVLMVHGTPAEPLSGYLYPDADLAPVAATGHRVVLAGQTHRPFVREATGTLVVNVGSCGLPRDCGDRGAVCLLDDERATARVLRYDIGTVTAVAVARCGDVAPEVLAVFERRSASGCMGDPYD
jgi:predicted phosphodiesterase